MSTTPEQLESWLFRSTEHQQLEFKEAKNQFDHTRLLRYCVAIANEGGGHLLLGVSDKPPRKIVGTKAFSDILNLTERLLQETGFRIDIEEFLHHDGRVLIFHIPSRPKGSAYSLAGAYWMRSGEQLVPMTEDQLRKIFNEGRLDWNQLIAKEKLSEQEVVELLDTQTFFELLKLPYPSDRNGVIERLKAEDLIKEKEGDLAISQLGALLLAKSLDSFPALTRKTVRVIVYDGNSKIKTKSDFSDKKGYAVGFQNLVEYVLSHLPQNEVIEGTLRREIKLVPEIVIREIVANALVHQDLEEAGTSVMVEIYDDRVEISNPGEPMVPPERFIDGYQSRNERLAGLMRRFGICEEKSSGIDKVIQIAEIFQLQAPLFEKMYHRTNVVIAGTKEFSLLDRDARVRACYQHCALRYVMRLPMNNQSLRERFKLPESKSVVISQVITATVADNLIKPDEKTTSSRKFARYVPFWA
jgi:predicted HTH transcriptional regulator